MGARLADRVRALTRRRRAAPTGTEVKGSPYPLRVEILPRDHGRLREFLVCENDADAVRVGIDTGELRASMRLGENYGINALTGHLTAWIPEPEEAEAEAVEWPAIVDFPDPWQVRATEPLDDLTAECSKALRVPKALLEPQGGQGTASPEKSRPGADTGPEGPMWGPSPLWRARAWWRLLRHEGRKP